jgi:hypothetical protein
MITCRQLVPGKKYYIKSHDTHIYFKEMIFEDYYTSMRYPINYGIDINMRFRRTTRYYTFFEKDYYYDPEKIRENAQKARQNMENRSINMILKKLVNEEFQWP